ncbi:MAG: hypothetical protein WA373_10180 [Burkholderiales bacterium]
MDAVAAHPALRLPRRRTANNGGQPIFIYSFKVDGQGRTRLSRFGEN